MNKKVDVFGIGIDNYTVDEALAIAEDLLDSDDIMNTIGYISSNLLMSAAEDEELRRYIAQLDLSIIGDTDVLDALCIKEKKKYDDIEKNLFMDAFFSGVVREGKSVFLLVDTSKQIEELNEFMDRYYEGIHIIGSYAAEASKEDDDTIINEINSISPDIIVSTIGTEFQKKFLFQNIQKLNARIWFGLADNEKARKSIGLKNSWLSKLVDKTLFKRMVSKYNIEKGE